MFRPQELLSFVFTPHIYLIVTQFFLKVSIKVTVFSLSLLKRLSFITEIVLLKSHLAILKL